MPIDPNVERMMKNVLGKAERTWGAGFALLGTQLQSAILNEELVILCDAQDDSIDPSTIVKILRQGRTWIVNWVNAHGGPLA